jgi:hypothetical protein
MVAVMNDVQIGAINTHYMNRYYYKYNAVCDRNMPANGIIILPVYTSSNRINHKKTPRSFLHGAFSDQTS